MASSNINICELPSELLEQILGYLKYDEISQIRLVCEKWNEIAQQLLNSGFSLVDRRHAQVQRDVKAQLPRRESERRNHLLAKHVNVLSSIETRISLLNMTYMKYIDMNLCCFIPGKVLDELLVVLDIVANTTIQPRAHELLQELRDISSMAMEHFDENIVPGLKAKIPEVVAAAGSPTFISPGPSTSYFAGFVTPTSPTLRPPAIRQEVQQLRVNLRANSTAILNLKKDVNNTANKVESSKSSSLDHTRKIAELAKTVAETQKQVSEQDARLSEMGRKIVDYEQKFTDLLQEVARLREVVEVGSTVPPPPSGGAGDAHSSRLLDAPSMPKLRKRRAATSVASSSTSDLAVKKSKH